MKKVLSGVVFCAACAGAEEPLSLTHTEALGWRLGVQAFSFTRISLFETIDRVSAVGLKYIEAYPGQVFSPEHGDLRFSHNLSAEHKAALKQKLRAAGLTLIHIGVVGLPNDEAECRRVFDFAKEMGLETIVSEPPAESLALVDALAQEYGINVAIHNHPDPSPYWHPDRVMAALEGRSSRMGACVDTSHWQRSGVDVLKYLRALEGRIKCFHLGDVDGQKRDAFLARKAALKEGEAAPTMADAIRQIPNVVYGEGPGDMAAWLAEVKRQGIKPVFSIEAFFELNPNEGQEKVAKSARVFEEIARKLAGE